MKRVVQTTGWGLLVLVVLLFVLVLPSRAQDDPSLLGELKITGANTDTFPSVQLQAYALDGQGNPIDLSTQQLFVSHGGVPADFVTYEGTRPVGTFTVFLIDAPSGVAPQIETIQNAIKEFANTNMQDQLDTVAIYRIGPEGPVEVLAPDQFKNGVTNALNTTPLQPEDGLTALIDSTLSMLDRLDSLKTNPAAIGSLVLISDGTDAVSTAQSTEVVARANELGIPIHTIVVDNPDLIEAGRELGRTYMGELATGSHGVAASLSDPASLAAIWSRISSFRDQALLRYTVLQPASGTFPVELSFVDNPDMRDTTEVNVSAALPSVVINLPFDSRTITVPSLEKPIDLRLSATISWLDGQTREIVDAGLIANGTRVSDIDPSKLADFTVPLSNLIYGDNTLEVVVTDDQNLTTSSGPVIVTVNEGELLVPEDLQPEGLPSWLPWALGIAAVVVLGLLALRLLNRNKAAAPSGGRRSRRKPAADAAAPVAAQPFVMAHLDVLEAQSLMPPEINLSEPEVTLGRSPTQVAVAFRDDVTVSRSHAVLRLEGSHYRLYDAGSTSGTFVNERQVPEYGVELFDGDIIAMGAVRLRYRQL